VAGLGCGGLGNFFRRLSGADAEAVLSTSWAAGIRYYDTAPFYGRGRSERRAGTFLERQSRAGFVLSTKVGRLLTPAPGGAREDGIFYDPLPFDSVYDYSYDGVMRSHEASLQRLGLARIDLLLVHDIGVMLHGADAAAQLSRLKTGGLKALEELRASGAIRGYGLGVNEVAACLDCLDYGEPDAFLLAGRYTLLEQQGVKPLLQRCRECGVSLIAAGVFNSGILATGATPDAHHNYAPASSEIISTVQRLERICAEHAVPLHAAALQFPLAHPAVTTVLLGAGTVRSLERSLEGLHTPIPDALWQQLVDEGFVDPELSPAGFRVAAS
jgi:D-threo-aldose 1-dehydrogenase